MFFNTICDKRMELANKKDHILTANVTDLRTVWRVASVADSLSMKNQPSKGLYRNKGTCVSTSYKTLL